MEEAIARLDARVTDLQIPSEIVRAVPENPPSVSRSLIVDQLTNTADHYEQQIGRIETMMDRLAV
jgi:hypothetical protein